MASLFQIRRALGQGVVLAAASAACGIVEDGNTPASGDGGAANTGGASAGGPNTGGVGAGGTASTGGEAGGKSDFDGVPSAELEPYPLEELVCTGEFYPDNHPYYAGQCCTTAECFSPANGICPPATKLTWDDLPALDDTGSCECGDEDRGPYARRDDHEPNSEGTCCYLITRITCVGRPFLVEAEAVLAPLVRNGDWGAPPERTRQT